MQPLKVHPAVTPQDTCASCALSLVSESACGLTRQSCRPVAGPPEETHWVAHECPFPGPCLPVGLCVCFPSSPPGLPLSHPTDPNDILYAEEVSCESDLPD